ncbi:MAG: hypothetical protein KA354_08620 [Phycisphaerae bacterium]|nr:hypothetical protein [Phycisphaerae bacterium]
MRCATTGVAVAFWLWVLVGQGQAQCLNEVWQLNLADDTWLRLAPVPDPVAGSPAPRRHFPHAFDSSRGRMLVSGGEGASAFADTWALELGAGSSAAWIRLQTAALDGPFTYRPGWYDPRRDRFVVAHAIDHLDVLDLTTNAWQLLPSAGSGVIQPYQLFGTSHAAVYDSVNDRYCVFGGGPITEITSFFNNHVHMLHPDTLVWSERALSPAPGPRGMAAVAFDPQSGGLMLFGGGLGGGSAGTLYNDTWSLSLQNGSGPWTPITTPVSPPARGQAAVVFDSLRQRMIVLGGLRYVASSCGSGTYTGLDDVWVLENGVWRELATTGDRPGPRRGAAAVYDAAGDRVILFGGEMIGLRAPSHLNAVVTGPSTVELSWTDNAAGEVGYLVRRWCNGASGETIATLEADSQSYTDAAASCGTCGYAVRAVGNCGISSPDSEATVVELCSEPLAITCPPVPEPIAVDQECRAPVPDLTSSAVVTGGQAPTTLTQVPAPGGWLEPGNHEVTLTATDADGTTAACTVAITVVDLIPPLVNITSPASWTSYPVHREVTLAGSFVENCSVGTSEWRLVSVAEEVNVPGILDPQAATVAAVHAFARPGIYAVELTVTDAAGNAGSAETASGIQDARPFVVIYDPDRGFMTGGGWFHSPLGACAASPDAVGKAVLSFNAKYQKNATTPHGNVQFLQKAGDLRFHSDDLEWLVVTERKAQLAGIGSVNGREGYQFILTAVAGRTQPDDRNDAVRLSIWNEAGVVYDNQPGAEPTGDAATPLAGGVIVVHE